MNLAAYEEKIYSQFTEDGITLALASKLDGPQFFVEIGAGDGSENNTRILAERRHWPGIWIEADVATCMRGRDLAERLGIMPLCGRAGRENAGWIKGLCAPRFGVLSIDIDGNDYWLWKALCEGDYGWKPALVIIECQIQKPRDEPYVMPYDPNYVWDNLSRDCGASVFSMKALGHELGYRFVGMPSNPHCPNAFFIREDLAYLVAE